MIEIKWVCSCPVGYKWTGNYDREVLVNVPENILLRRNDDVQSALIKVGIDKCLVEEIKELWRYGITTTGCCCGHNQKPPYIGVIESDIPRMRLLWYETSPHILEPEREDSFYPKSIRRVKNDT